MNFEINKNLGIKLSNFFSQPILCTVLIYLVRDPETWQRLRSHDCISSDTQQHKIFVTTYSFCTFLSLVVPGVFLFYQTCHHHLLHQSFRYLGPWIMAWILFESQKQKQYFIISQMPHEDVCGCRLKMLSRTMCLSLLWNAIAIACFNCLSRKEHKEDVQKDIISRVAFILQTGVIIVASILTQQKVLVCAGVRGTKSLLKASIQFACNFSVPLLGC